MPQLKKHFAVIGNPIHHSLSPQIHAAFAKDANLDMTYEAILSPLDQFKQTIKTIIGKPIILLVIIASYSILENIKCIKMN